MNFNLPDTQSSEPNIKIGINRVGIDNFKLPLTILTKDSKPRTTVTDISCFVNLSKNKKGINMSRLPIILNSYVNEVLNGDKLVEMAAEIRNISEAEECQLIYKFPYFLNKESPVVGMSGTVYYNVIFDITNSKDISNFKISVESIVTTLCPCSKEMSTHNAHNQKCYITIEVLTDGWVWIEDIIKIAEESGSCEIYSILKRPDEKYVTDKMYENPKFVEDVVREASIRLSKLEYIKSFKISAIADESIHLHSAIAIIESE